LSFLIAFGIGLDAPLVERAQRSCTKGWLLRTAQHLSVVSLRDPSICEYFEDESGMGLLVATPAVKGRWESPRAIGVEEYCGVLVTKGRDTRLFRDHVGTRPLYFCRHEGCWLASTETRVLLSMIGAAVADLKTVAVLLQPAHAFQCPPDRTGFVGIWRVPPGHTAVLKDDGLVNFERDWLPECVRVDQGISFRDAIDETRRLFLRAISRRVPPKSLVGCHMSGGLDSTTIALASKELTSSVHCFSWTMDGYHGPESDELGRIHRLGAAKGLQVSLLSEEFLHEEVCRLHDLDPVEFPRISTGLELAIMRQASELGVARMLSGWGGDEGISFGGEGFSIDFLMRGKLKLAIRRFWRRDGESVMTSLCHLPRRIRKELLSLLLSQANVRRRSTLCCASAALRRRYQIKWSSDQMLAAAPGVHAMQLRFFRAGFLAERMEAWWCHGRRFGLDYCYPLLDRELLEFTLRIPGEFFFRAGKTRAIFREVARPFWEPESVDIDLKADHCLHSRFPELKLQEAPHDDAVGLEEFVDRNALAELYRQSPPGWHKVVFAIALLRRCGGRVKHWKEAENVSCIA